MSDEVRIEWSERHRQHVALLEKAFAAVVFLLGLGMVIWFEGRVQSVGIGVAAVGLYNFFPDIRPLLSGLADRLPFLASKTDK